MNSIIALVYLSVAVILIVFGVKQIKNRKKLRKINQKQEEYFMKCRRILKKLLF